MGKGTIISNTGEGLYSVTLLQDRSKVEAELERLNRWIALNLERTAALPPEDPGHKLPGLKLALASLTKQKEYLEKIPPDETVNAWCVDYSVELSGDVGTIEINGEPEAGVNIRPGYGDNAAHNPDRDGQLQNIMAMTAEQAFYNMAMMPGWQKWMPTYRVGTITGITGDTCDVELGTDISSLSAPGTGDLNINQAFILSNVDIQYMSCNGNAFTTGDRVIVQFVGQDFKNPMVVGFEREPRACGNLLFVNVNVNNEIEFYDYDSGSNTVSLIRTLDIRPLVQDFSNYPWDSNIPEFKQVSLVFAEGDMNCIVVQMWVTNWRGNVYDYYDPYWSATNCYLLVKIPIDFHDNAHIEAGLAWRFAANHPSSLVMSQSGMVLYAAYRVAGGYGGYGAHPLDWYDHAWPYQYFEPIEILGGLAQYMIPAIGVMGDTVVVAYIEWQGNILYKSHIEIDSILWVGQEPRHRVDRFELKEGWSTTFPTPAIFDIAQIVCDDGYIFILYGTRHGHGVAVDCDIAIEVYDAELTMLKTKQAIPGISGNVLGRVTVVTESGKKCLCFRTQIYDPYISIPQIQASVYLVDVETLTIFRTIDMPLSNIDRMYIYSGTTCGTGGELTPAFIGTTKPHTNYLLDRINEYRFLQTPYSTSMPPYLYYQMPISYMGYSRKLVECAGLHANWCAANGRAQHEDANGNKVYSRGLEFGYRYDSMGENIAYIDTSVFVSTNDQYDEIFRIWKESPEHNLNLVSRDLNTMGIASAMYPESVHSITLGPGVYNPETGEYSTGESSIELAPSQYGKFKIFVYNVAQG